MLATIFHKPKIWHRVSKSRSFASLGGTTKPKVCWLDLNGSGLSAIERLCLEEALLRHDPQNRSWAIVGAHDPIYSSRLKLNKYLNKNKNNDNTLNENCIIIMGIGGKPEQLINLEKVQKDGVVVIKRFSGGGTVVVDHSSLWTTFIGRTDDFPHVQPYPKDIMKWSADEIFDGVFKRFDLGCNGNGAYEGKTLRSLVMDTKSCGLASMNHSKSSVNIPNKGNNSKQFPTFKLKENDYVLDERKMGGNAQSIIKGGWLHHTSFLWDYDNDNMEYLLLPQKRPDYRGDRHHDDFLVKLKTVYGHSYSDVEGKRIFFEHLKDASRDSFDLEESNVDEALKIVENELGGFQHWFDGKCRTKIIEI